MSAFVLLIVIIVISCVAQFGMWAAYRNGVRDGYGFSREPNNPGYQKAGAILRAYSSHRWSELNVVARLKGEEK